MRKTALAAAACVAVFRVVLTSALASGPPSRTPDGKAIPMLSQANVSLLQGIKQTQTKYGRAIEAKFELDDSGSLSVSVYAASLWRSHGSRSYPRARRSSRRRIQGLGIPLAR